MRKISFLLGLAVILASCGQDFKKGEKGLEYKIISSGSGPALKNGDFMQLQVCQILNNKKTDSVLNDTRTTSGPVIERMDTLSIPAEYYKILAQLRKGDSVAIRLLTDTMFARNPDMMPPFIKKGCYYVTTVKLLNIFKTKEQVDSAQKLEMLKVQERDSINNLAQMAKDDKALQSYFAKNKINPIKAPKGTYVLITKPGTGANIDTSVVVKTNYTGRTLDGKMFDSNTDSSKGHVEPFSVNMTNDMSLGNGVIPGWTDGLKMLNKGAVAKFYIPSVLAYGSRGAGADIAPNSILVFDIEVLDVMTKDQARAENLAKMKERKEKQKRYMDSVAKANPETSRKK